MFRDPDGIVTVLIHRSDALHGARVNLLQIAPATRPTEKL
jgi:hypothetical protein